MLPFLNAQQLLRQTLRIDALWHKGRFVANHLEGIALMLYFLTCSDPHPPEDRQGRAPSPVASQPKVWSAQPEEIKPGYNSMPPSTIRLVPWT